MPCIAVLILIPLIPIMIHIVVPIDVLRLILVTISDFIVGLIIIYFVVLSSSERVVVNNIIKSYRNK